MNPRLRERVRQRAEGRCEYCHAPEALSRFRFQADHIIAEKHGGVTDMKNLAWAYFRCNSHKGPNVAGWDGGSGATVRLYHPRMDIWKEHFRWSGPRLVGKTLVGRATIDVLCINRKEAIELRAAWLSEGVKLG
jgi:hypothetical protein